MASALNKRQQARNERALQDLIKTVPGNGTCADCGARNPGWASWSLGIFLCMRCAALHRKLGTHISKVKSLSMDKWDNAQVDNMKRIGNLESNKTYNPRNVKPSIPIDIDEVDSAMERYIRAKYEQRIYLDASRPGTRQNTGSTSSEDRPPPLPPKPTGRFGFGLRKASTTRDLTPPLSPGLGGFSQHDQSPPRINKPSRVFGSNIHTSGDGLDSKLTTLRDMGFPDDKRNATVLKGLNGNLDRAVEALIRLGEQDPGRSRGSTPTPASQPASNGISFDTISTAPPTASSTNPFDALDAPAQAPQQQPQLAPLQTQQTSYNPFLQQAPQGYAQQQAPQGHVQQQQQQQNFGYQQNPWDQQQQSLEQTFQGMQISQQQPQQPLFPNRTGGYADSTPSSFAQTNPYNQSFTPPPMPQIPEQYSAFFAPQQPQYQSMSNPSSPGNPFLRSSKSQMFTPTNLASSNPFGQPTMQQQQQQMSQPMSAPPQQQMPNPWSQQMQQQQQQQQQQPQQQQQQQQQQLQQQQQQQLQQQQQPQYNQVSTPQSANPWQTQQSGFQNQDPQQNYQTQQQSFQNQQALYQQQSSNPFDKNASILSLYNQPQQAPQQAPQQQAQPTAVQASTPAAQVPGRANPFGNMTGAPQGQALSAAQTPGLRHVSNESVDFSGLMSGRHSPDAFAGLSSSFRR